MADQLQKLAPPALPQSPEEFFRQYQDQLNNVHRLFYNRLTQSYNGLIDPIAGGKGLYFPYGAFQRDTDFSFTSANTAQLIALTSTDFASNTMLLGGDGTHVEQSGVYNYQYSVQFSNTDSTMHTAWLWLRDQDGDVAGTASKFDVPSSHGSSDGYLLAACNFYVQLPASGYVELWGAASQVENGVTNGIYIEAYPAQTVPFAMPSVPSVVTTVSFVSNI